MRCITSISTRLFATGSRDTTVRLWGAGVSSGAPRCVHVLRGHTHPVTSLSFDPDSNLLASTGKDACRVWRPTGESVAVLSSGHANVSASVFTSPAGGGLTVVVGDDEGKVVIWDVMTGVKLQTLDGHAAMIRLIVAPQEPESILVTADITGTTIAWTYDSEWQLKWKVPEAHAFSVSAMRIKDNCLLTSGADGKIRMWGLETGELLREVEESYDAVYDVAFQEDLVGNEIVVVASRNARMVLDVS